MHRVSTKFQAAVLADIHGLKYGWSEDCRLWIVGTLEQLHAAGVLRAY
jgi:hypothetical protein